jgi:excisionase family DNA binding protein
MSQPFLTVEQAAERLSLHPKTVRRFIREGRIKATRIGKSYRILEADLAQFAGGSVERASGPAARVTSVVDIDNVDSDTAQRLARFFPGALYSRDPRPDPISLQVMYDPERQQLKVVLAGSPARVAMYLSHIELTLASQP